MTLRATSIAEVPRVAAVYAFYGGERRGWVAYVGIAGNLHSRLDQHFVKRDSSVVTGTSAVGVNIDHVRYVEWWTHPRFEGDDQRHAAELLAFDVFDPALRSRGLPRQAALNYLDDRSFVNDIRAVLAGPAAGRLVMPKLADLAQAISDLERRIQALEKPDSQA